ncbi:hypothetical protein [Candidatus Pelagisphaera phototrophica]|uniref:hypothetical protein n=1 Tax=Candidatus Pelagisphaera phototrophica TaxID=2684113 RepID=UPI001A05F5F5|nr:hypothetical protein [Candidatus Pelagisphaera phototrophica]QXD31831.1 hypothetical protein GA004_16200 [Candidatus Pelagisphaera phototrophica]
MSGTIKRMQFHERSSDAYGAFLWQRGFRPPCRKTGTARDIPTPCAIRPDGCGQGIPETDEINPLATKTSHYHSGRNIRHGRSPLSFRSRARSPIGATERAPYPENRQQKTNKGEVDMESALHIDRIQTFLGRQARDNSPQ